MTRRAHLWFFVGVLLSGLLLSAIAIAIALVAATWSSSAAAPVLFVEAMVVLAVARQWIVNRRLRAQQQLWRISRELKRHPDPARPGKRVPLPRRSYAAGLVEG